MVDEFEKYARKTKAEPVEQKPAESFTPADFSRYERTPTSGINWGEVAMDLAHTPVDLAKSIYSGVSNLPDTAKSLYSEFQAEKDQPMMRQLKNRLIGFAQFGDTLNQAPANIVDYFKRKGASEDFGSFIKRPEPHNWQEYFNMGDTQPGDAFGQAMGKLAPNLAFAATGAIPASVVGGLYEAGENRNPLVPAAGILAAKSAMSAYKTIKSTSGKKIATDTLAARDEARAISNQNYQQFENMAQQTGATQAYQPPVIQQAILDRLLDSVPGAYVENLENYINNGARFEDAVKTVSDLRGYASRIRNMTDATPEQIAAARAAKNAANLLDKSIADALKVGGGDKLADFLKEIRKFHADEVIPYKPHGEKFNLFSRNRIDPEVLIAELEQNPEFMHMLSDRFPGFANRNRLDMAKKIGLGVGVAGGLGGGALSAYNFYKGSKE